MAQAIGTIEIKLTETKAVENLCREFVRVTEERDLLQQEVDLMMAELDAALERERVRGPV